MVFGDQIISILSNHANKAESPPNTKIRLLSLIIPPPLVGRPFLRIIYAVLPHYNLILKMNRSTSARVLPQHSKSPSRRGIYLNDQTIKRQKNTTFHSPYKDGKPNKDYINPSFISSNLFYPNEYTQDKNITVQKNYIPNSNDIKKETLYRQRLRTDAAQRQRERSKTKEKEPPQRTREFRQDHHNNNKIIRLNEPEKLLSSELECLRNYRECLEDRNKERRSQPPIRQDLPPYFQKSRRDMESSLKQEASNRAEMNNWMAVTSELQELKKEMRRTNQAIEQDRAWKMVQENQNHLLQQETRQRKEAELLGNILRQQMRTNELRKDRKWNY